MCPCNSQKNYVSCCKPLITEIKIPETPEALMRSRYTAYSMANMTYIKETMCGNALLGFDELDAKRWARRVIWIKLKIFKSSIESSGKAYVEFEASFLEGSHLKSIHEKSEFIFEKERWYYIGGEHLPTTHAEQRISRTMDCPCGSHRKLKNCHGK